MGTALTGSGGAGPLPCCLIGLSIGCVFVCSQFVCLSFDGKLLILGGAGLNTLIAGELFCFVGGPTLGLRHLAVDGSTPQILMCHNPKMLLSSLAPSMRAQGISSRPRPPNMGGSRRMSGYTRIRVRAMQREASNWSMNPDMVCARCTTARPWLQKTSSWSRFSPAGALSLRGATALWPRGCGAAPLPCGLSRNHLVGPGLMSPSQAEHIQQTKPSRPATG